MSSAAVGRLVILEVSVGRRGAHRIRGGRRGKLLLLLLLLLQLMKHFELLLNLNVGWQLVSATHQRIGRESVYR